MFFEFFIGSRYLRSKQKQAFISLITILSIAGVTVGVMALIVVIAVMTGFEADLKSRILGVESHIVVMSHNVPFSDYRNVLKHIENTEGVEAATPFVNSQTILRSSLSVSGAVLRGIDPDSADRVIKKLDKLSLKNLKEAAQRKNTSITMPSIILGKQLAKNLGLIQGDSVYLISPKGMISPIGHIPTMKRFRVAGLFESGMYEYDRSLAFIHIKDAQKILHMGDSINGIEVRVNDIYNARNIGDKIVKKLDFQYWARDWMQMNQNLFSALKLEKTVMFIILALIVLVAAFNISSTLIMMVMEKTKDVAILKAMGATDKSIRRIFVFKGAAIGFIGTFLGVCLGFLLCVLLKHYQFIELPGDVYYITTLPVQLELLDVVMIASSAIAICLLATIYPARQASGLNPVEALRYG